jgi:two-component system phosphate regulon sensor histidine kinase PhoR
MATLTREVKKFATDKKLEIETLKVREEYRRISWQRSHELKTLYLQYKVICRLCLMVL